METTIAQKKLLKRREPKTGWDKTVSFTVMELDILNKVALIYISQIAQQTVSTSASISTYYHRFTPQSIEFDRNFYASSL